MPTDTIPITWEELQALTAVPDHERVPVELSARLSAEIVRCEVLAGGALYRQLLCVRLFDVHGGWSNGCATLETWLGIYVGWPYTTANERVRVARSLKHLPKLDAAFREGRLSYTKVRAIHDVATPANEETLIEQARAVSGEQLRQLVAPLRAAVRRAKVSQATREELRGVAFRTREHDDLIDVQATLLPEEAATLKKALEVGRELGIKQARVTADAEPESAAADQPRQRFGSADALAFLAEGFLTNPPVTGVPAGRRELLIHTVSDLSTGQSEHGDALGAETLRRLACDGATREVERGPEGEVLAVGRRTRRISRRMERALLIRDRCCRFPGCRRRALLDAHRIEHWADGGKTKLDNLVRLCRTHHRLVHEGAWTVSRRPDGSFAFRNQHGEEVDQRGRLPELRAWEAYERLDVECRARGLDPEPDQLTATEGGERIPDYGWATAALSDACGFARPVRPYDADPDRELPAAIGWLLREPG